MDRDAGTYWELRYGDTLRLLLDLGDDSVDGVFTDCPYSSGGMVRGDRTCSTLMKYISNDSSNQALPEFLGDTRDQRSFGFWASLWLSECLRVTKPGGVILSFTDWRQLPASSDALQAGGWVWRGIVPWNKTEATRPQLGRPRAQCEYLLFGTKGPHRAYDGAPALPGFFEVVSPRDRYHIAQKPLELMLELVKLVPPGGLVFDPFCGSGTTAIAAVRSGRRALAFELDPATGKLAAERLRAEEEGLDLGEARAGQAGLFDSETGGVKAPG